MRDAFPIVCAIGDRLGRERTGWRDVKALVYLVAYEGDWRGAAALAEALGVSPDAQEAIYREVTERHLQEATGRANPANHHRKREPACSTR